MKLQAALPGNARMFTAHGEHAIQVNGVDYTHSIAVRASEVREDWRVDGFDALTAEDFRYFVALEPEVILFGSGARQRFAAPELYRDLTRAGIPIEFMDTPAACRTYNILVAEGRKVIAAVLP